MKRTITIIATTALAAALLPTLPAVANNSTPTTNPTNTTTINQRSDIQPQTRARKKTKTRKASLSLTVTRANNGNKPTVRVRSNAQKVRVTAWNTSGKRVGTKTIRIKRTKDLKKATRTFKLAWNRVTKIQATTVATTVRKGKKRTRLTVNRKVRTIKVRATKPAAKPSKPATPGNNDGVWVGTVPTITITHYSLNSVKLTVRANSTFSGCYLVVQTRPAGGTWEGTNIENSCGTHTGQQVVLNKSGGHEFRARLVHVNQDWEEKPASNYSPVTSITQPTLAQVENAFIPAYLTAYRSALVTKLNSTRATGQTCGSTWMPAAPALTVNNALNTAAQNHAQDMYTNNFYSHTGTGGTSHNQRAQNAGYTGTGVSEILSGSTHLNFSPLMNFINTSYTTPITQNVTNETKRLAQLNVNAAIQSWLGSTPHCTNLMQQYHVHVGVGTHPNSLPQVAMFGRP